MRSEKKRTPRVSAVGTGAGAGGGVLSGRDPSIGPAWPTTHLPFVGSWNAGPAGYNPNLQLQLLRAGAKTLIPWFKFADPNTSEELARYEETLRYAASHKLPVTLIGSQWEKMLYVLPEYFSRPPGENPNVTTTAGVTEPKVCPFGPASCWSEVGRMWTDREQLKAFQEIYPNPPYVLLVSNNEANILKWKDAETSKRYVDRYGLGREDSFKRQVIGDGYIERYNAMLSGIRSGLTAWRDVSVCLAYNAITNGGIWWTSTWIDHYFSVPGRFTPWVDVWDGASISNYVNDFDITTDFTGFSPQVKTQNLPPILDWATKRRPDFWIEMSVWDGRNPGNPNDMWAYYQSLGQTYTPERFVGYVQFGMWTLRPRTVRDFRLHNENASDTIEYFKKILTATENIHNNGVLKDFWVNGYLVSNRKRKNFFNVDVWVDFSGSDRWFLLDVDVNPSYPYSRETPIPVFALALVQGSLGNRKWLVYLFSPLQDYPAVNVIIPRYKSVRLASSISGSYYLLQERLGIIEKIEVPQ